MSDLLRVAAQKRRRTLPPAQLQGNTGFTGRMNPASKAAIKANRVKAIRAILASRRK